MIKALVLVGPTAVGKTNVSLELAGDTFHIVSSDSVQVYRYLDIGSGKPTPEERERVQHYLVDIVDPDFVFTAGTFCEKALNASGTIQQNGKIPFFVGGTGLYIDSFFKGLSDIPLIDEQVRNQLQKDVDTYGLDTIYHELCSVDPVFCQKVHRNDKQRIMRGVEVFRGTGRPLSGYYEEKNGHESVDTLYIGLYEDRQIVRKRIADRTDQMIKNGFIEEVKKLRKMGYGPELKSMKSIGYKEINQYIDGLFSFEDMVELIKTETARYAKRQMTWFRRNKNINWFKNTEISLIREMIKKWLD